MFRDTLRVLTIVLCVACFTRMVAAQQWGDLTGKFVYDGPVPKPAKLNVTKDVEVCGKHPLVDETLVVADDGSLANVVVYLRGVFDKAGKVETKKIKVHPDFESTSEPVKFDNKNCRFEPHVLAVRTGQVVILGNADTVGHNTNLQPLGDQPINPLLPAAGTIEYKFRRAQTVGVPISCNIHPWMKGWIVPRDNPYVAVSGTDGTFKIEKLPVGELEFVAWQEQGGYVRKWDKGRFKMAIKPGANDMGVIKIKPEWIAPKT